VLRVRATEPGCTVTPSSVEFDERTTSASVRVAGTAAGECAVRYSLDESADAHHFAAPSDALVAVVPYERFTLSAPTQQVLARHDDSSSTLEVRLSHAPRSALTVTPMADALLFEPPSATLDGARDACSFRILGRRPGTFTVSFALDGLETRHIAAPPTAEVTVLPLAIELPAEFAPLVAGVSSAPYVARLPPDSRGASNVSLVLNGSLALHAQPSSIRFGEDGVSQPFTLTGLSGGELALGFALAGPDAKYYAPPPPATVSCKVIAATRLRLLSVPSRVVAGEPFSVLVDVLNPDGERHVDLEGQSSVTVSLIVMTYESQIFQGVSSSSIEEVGGVANITMALAKAVPIRLVASAPGLAADASGRIEVLPNTLSVNATEISCGRKHILAGEASTCFVHFRDAYGNAAAQPADVRVHLVESGGRRIDVEMARGGGGEGSGGGGGALADEGTAPPLNFTFTTAHTGVATLVVDWAAPGGAGVSDGRALSHVSYEQPVSIFAGMLVPSMTDFACAPNPVRAGEVAQCTIITRGPFGNRAAGAEASDFEVLLGTGFSYASDVHVKGIDEFGFVVYAETMGASTISIRFRGDRWALKSIFFQEEVTILAGEPAISLSVLTCEPNPVTQGAHVTCELTSRDLFGNVASLPAPPPPPPPADGETSAPPLSAAAALARAIEIRALDSSGQSLALSPLAINAQHSHFSFGFTAGRVGPTVVSFAHGRGRPAEGRVLVTPPHNAFLPSSPYKFEGGSQSARDQLMLMLAFGFLAIASTFIARMATSLGVPLVTGYLAVGIIVGPHGLMLLPYNGPSHLGFIGQLALGFIGFSAGAKFYLNELKEYIRKVLYITAGLVALTYAFTFSAVTAFGGVIPYMDGMTPSQKLGVALLFSCLAVARSPSSSIAIISELNAAGPFTTIMLAVIVMMDVFVVVLFSLTSLAVIALDKVGREAEAGADGGGHDARSSDVLIIFALQMVVSVVGGFLVANVLVVTMVRVPSWQLGEGALGLSARSTSRANSALRVVTVVLAHVQMALFIAIGYAVFALEDLSSELLGFSIMQPMIVCMTVCAPRTGCLASACASASAWLSA
jgi:hypothetical protein